MATILRSTDLLACQHPLTGEHDEVLFIVIHQASELWIKLCLHEVAGAIRQIRTGELGPAFKMMARVARVQANLIQSWEILSTMTPFDYASFPQRARQIVRAFNPSSTACSSFGSATRIARWRGFSIPSAYRGAGEAALVEPSIYDESLALLARRGFPVPRGKLERDFSEPYVADANVLEAWRQVYRDAETHWDLYELAEKLVDLEYRFHLWRFSHMKTVDESSVQKPARAELRESPI